ncbi:MAG: SRPBCC family protein [Gaiellaceae bacterium]
MTYEHELEIERPPADVYAFLADPENLPRWQSEVLEVRRESETRFREVRTFIGRRIESTLEVTAAEPGREFSLRSSSGPVRFSVRHLLEPAGEGRTLLRVLGEAEGAGGLFKLGGRLLRRAAERRFQEDFARLKDILEAG